MNKTNSEKRALTIGEVAIYAGVSYGTVTNWINARLLPFHELPSTGTKYHFRRIMKSDIDFFLAGCRESPREKNESTKSRPEIILLPKAS